MEMKVKVVKIGETQTFPGSDFTKRDLIGFEDGQYPTEFLFEFPQQKGDLLNNISVGEDITVHFNIRCRKVSKPLEEDRYFTSLSGWRIN